MLDPHELYEIHEDVPDLGRPVLIQALTGFVDAGHAARLTRHYLTEALDAQPLVTFDIDQLLDYRSRRPVMQFVEDHWADYEDPKLVLLLLRDREDTPFLLLDGAEPDLQWERFTSAMVALVRQLGVRLTVGVNAIPMGVPHTRPAGVTAHATRQDLIRGYEPWLQRVQVPGSAGHLLEYRMGQQGLDAIGFAVHVPHYLAQVEYPPAAETLLTSISRATGLLLPTEKVHTDGETVRVDVDRQVAASPEAAELVQGLEAQYDTYLRGRPEANLLAQAGPLPTAEELGAELEQFLAEHGRGQDG